ncbi:MAG: TolC family protein [Alphaproteobacteria bacterium]
MGRSHVRRVGAAAAVALLVSACALRAYEPRPIVPDEVAGKLTARDVSDAGLRAFLERHGFKPAEWPLKTWSLAGLTLMAIYFHPDMDVARANLEMQEAAKITAGQRPNPTLGPELQHHSDLKSGTPWSVGVALDVAFETGGKREARQARAAALSEEARLAVGAAAWNVRVRLGERYTNLFAAQRETELLRRELAAVTEEVALLERRQALGEASPSEASLARIRQRELRLALDSADGAIATGTAALADSLGLPYSAAAALTLPFDEVASAKPEPLPAQAIERTARDNRLDIRRALASYAAAEATLREEIAKQFPDLTLSPSLLWDQADWVKTLGLSVLAPIFNRNEGPIAEAEARRKLEAAKFTALLAQVMGQVSQTRLGYEAAVKAWVTADGLVAAQTERLRQAEKLIAYGETDKLSLVQAEIELVAAERAQLRARVEALRALGAVEDAVQYPLYETGPLPDLTEGAGEAPGKGAP